MRQVSGLVRTPVGCHVVGLSSTSHFSVLRGLTYYELRYLSLSHIYRSARLYRESGTGPVRPPRFLGIITDYAAMGHTKLKLVTLWALVQPDPR